MGNIVRIKKTESGFENVRWCLIAVSKHNTNYTLNAVLVEDGWMVAIDGRRLHKARILESIENGLYSIVSNKASEVVLESGAEGKFPNYRMFIPTEGEIVRWEVEAGVSAWKHFVAQYAHKFYPETMIDPELAEDTVGETGWKVSTPKALHPVVLESNDGEYFQRVAVIMPMRVRD